jgi:hypothetical protein
LEISTWLIPAASDFGERNSIPERPLHRLSGNDMARRRTMAAAFPQGQFPSAGIVDGIK